MYSSIYYNLYVATTTTTQGKSCNSAMALFFESFLNNNVPMGSLNEVITFINYVIKEPRAFKDSDILDRDVTIQDCFYQLMSSTGWGWIPTEDEMEVVWSILNNLGQEDLNRLFYKNNLFYFIDNTAVKNTILRFLQSLTQPYMDPNEVPMIDKDTKNETAIKELNLVLELLHEYVFYNHQIIDRLDKMYFLIRSNSIIQDTDSAIISLDGWYRYVLQMCDRVPMAIKTATVELEKFLDGEENYGGQYDLKVPDYDFMNDEIIEIERNVDPMIIIPQDGLKFSIINLIAYCLTKMVNEYMEEYCKNSNSDSNGECMITLKNEFLKF